MPTHLPLLARLLLPMLVADAAPPGGASVAAPTLTVGDVQVTEGDDGMTAFTTSVTLMGTSSSVDVQVFGMAATANDADFSVPMQLLTVSTATPVSVTGYVLGDRRYEGPETFLLYAQPVQATVLNFRAGTITIVDDDEAKAPHVSAAPLAIPEGNGGWHRIQVPLRLDRAPETPVVVSYESGRGTPATTTVPWGDYRSSSGQVTFDVGETTAFIPIEVNGDTAWEADATFELGLTSSREGVLDTTTIPVTLVNDDRPAGVTLENVRVDEGGDRHPLSLRLVFDAPAPPLATVRVDVVGGTARDGEDFVGASLELHPAPGATSLTFAATILGDATPECDEGIIVEYRGVRTGDDARKEARILLADDDGAKRDSDDGGSSDAGDASDDGGACADPFATRSAPVEPGPDAAAPPPLRVDAAADEPAARPGGGGCALAGSRRVAGRGSILAMGLLLTVALRGARRRTTQSRHSRP